MNYHDTYEEEVSPSPEERMDILSAVVFSKTAEEDSVVFSNGDDEEEPVIHSTKSKFFATTVCSRRRLIIGGAVGIVLLILVVVLAVTLGEKAEANLTPTQIEAFLRSASQKGGGEFDNPSSHEYQALLWNQNNPVSSEARVLQRYALVCIYYATYQMSNRWLQVNKAGDDLFPWSNSKGWLTYDNECDWFGVSCDGKGLGPQRFIWYLSSRNCAFVAKSHSPQHREQLLLQPGRGRNGFFWKTDELGVFIHEGHARSKRRYT
jgi:hypothetical protein